jgi:hypothetical protein
MVQTQDESKVRRFPRCFYRLYCRPLDNLSVERVHDYIFCCQDSSIVHVSLVYVIDYQGRENSMDEGI